MRTIAALILVVGMAGCATQGQTCSGWTQPPVPNDPARMAQVERPVSDWLVSTKEYGAKIGCW